MANLKKYNYVLKHFVIFLTLFFIALNKKTSEKITRLTYFFLKNFYKSNFITQKRLQFFFTFYTKNFTFFPKFQIFLQIFSITVR